MCTTYYIVVRKEINFQSVFIISERSCDVYSQKAVKTLMYLKLYEYSTLYVVRNILLFFVIEVLDSK